MLCHLTAASAPASDPVAVADGMKRHRGAANSFGKAVDLVAMMGKGDGFYRSATENRRFGVEIHQGSTFAPARAIGDEAKGVLHKLRRVEIFEPYSA